jgi:DNA-directed RNA polymerase specialized sigma24 family protein
MTVRLVDTALRRLGGSTMSGTDQRVAADCEHYIRSHHPWLARMATTIGRAYALHPKVQEELLAELYEVLFRKWNAELLRAGEHARNGYAYRVLMDRAQRHRRAGSWRSGADPTHLPARAVLTDALSPDERDVIMLTYGLGKDPGQIAGELGLPARTIPVMHDRALAKLALAAPRLPAPRRAPAGERGAA